MTTYTWCSISRCDSGATWHAPTGQYLCDTHQQAYQRGDLPRPSTAAVPKEQMSLLDRVR